MAQKKKKKGYGTGQNTPDPRTGKWRVRIPNGKGGYVPVGTYKSFEEGERWRMAALLARETDLTGTTLRQWGATWLQSHEHMTSYERIVVAWRVLERFCPYMDKALEELNDPDVTKWFQKQLPLVPKTRARQSGGKWTWEALNEPISHTYAAQILGHATRCFERAVRKGHMDGNPLSETTIGKPNAPDEDLSWLPQDEIERLLSCERCAVLKAQPASDIDMLARCPHMPFEQRVVFTLEVHQCPRQGELAGMTWERCDWLQHGWHIKQSWGGRTKNKKNRWQAWIPRAERALRKWWELAGCPKKGIVFPSTAPGTRQRPGAKRQFVLAQPADWSAKGVVLAAEVAGINLTKQEVADIRYRAKVEKLAPLVSPQKRYAKGHDWGWADHPEETLTRLGWWRRCGLATRIKFHEFRDTAATHLLSGTWGEPWSIEAVSDFLGHSDIKVTQERYAHLTVQAKQRAAQSIESDRSFVRRPAANLPQGNSGVAAKHLESLAPEVGLEPTTRRLTDVRSGNESNGLAAPRQVCGMFAAAQAVLASSAAGRTVKGSAICKLAEAVLEHPWVELANRILEGGPHALAQALELAKMVADAPAAPGRMPESVPSRVGGRPSLQN